MTANVMVVGAWFIGTGIAQDYAQSGYRHALICDDQRTLGAELL